MKTKIISSRFLYEATDQLSSRFLREATGVAQVVSADAV